MTSKPQSTETALSDTGTATAGSTHDETHHSSDWIPAGSQNTLKATAGRTPPLRTRPSSSTHKDSKSSKKKPASKSSKHGSVQAKARDSKTSLSRASGSRSVDAKKSEHPASLPEAPSAEPRKVEQVQTARRLSPGGTSESLVTISRDTGSNDEPLSPSSKKHGLLSSSSKCPSDPEQPASSASNNKQGTVPPSPKQTSGSPSVPQNKQDARQSEIPSAEISRSSTMSHKTPKTPAETSEVWRAKSSVPACPGTPDPGPRNDSDIDSSPLLDVLVGNMRGITGEGGGAGSSLDDSSAARLPFSSSTGSAPPAAPAVLPSPPAPPVPREATREVPAFGQPAARDAGLDKGCDLFGFTATAGTGSLLLVVLLYLFKGFLSHAIDCSDFHNCTTSNVTYMPLT